MTCDLIIGNGAGVALATEVVPATSHYERPDPTTTMLGLPKPHAVGIIIHSGSSTIFGVPYETHLENWIQTLSEKPLGAILRTSSRPTSATARSCVTSSGRGTTGSARSGATWSAMVP